VCVGLARTVYLPVYDRILVMSLLEIPYITIHRIYIVLANPECAMLIDVRSICSWLRVFGPVQILNVPGYVFAHNSRHGGKVLLVGTPTPTAEATFQVK
jgi:hypothetical protein